MYETAMTFEATGVANDEEYSRWILSNTPWAYENPFNPRKGFVFYNQITKKMTIIPVSLLSRNLLYFPTNSPGTGERFVPVIFAVNGRYDINYDEGEHRFDKSLNYKSPNHHTRIDIFVCRQPDYKKDKEDEEQGMRVRDMQAGSKGSGEVV